MTKTKELETALLCRIAAGEWRGGKLPSFTALRAEYGIALGTLQKVIAELAGLQLITTKQGSGCKLEEGAKNMARQELRRILAERKIEILKMAEAANVSVEINYEEKDNA